MGVGLIDLFLALPIKPIVDFYENAEIPFGIAIIVFKITDTAAQVSEEVHCLLGYKFNKFINKNSTKFQAKKSLLTKVKLESFLPVMGSRSYFGFFDKCKLSFKSLA